jgi:hypothetical protein
MTPYHTLAGLDAYQQDAALILTDCETIDEAQASGRWIRYEP